jgi:hypothetical protein
MDLAQQKISHFILALRRSREITLLCSPRVAQHHGELGGVLAQGKSVFLPHGGCRLAWSCRTQPPLVSPAHAIMYCNSNALRAFSEG